MLQIDMKEGVNIVLMERLIEGWASLGDWKQDCTLPEKNGASG
jgi:hypothetical protein